jgi:hypothetical protein
VLTIQVLVFRAVTPHRDVVGTNIFEVHATTYIVSQSRRPQAEHEVMILYKFNDFIYKHSSSMYMYVHIQIFFFMT